MRFPEFEGGWCLINISELLDFQNGINADSDKYGRGIKYISVSDILNNPYICYDDIKGLVDIDNSTLEHYKVEYGDIVFQRSSETFEDIGHANVYLDKSRSATFGGFVIRGKKKGSYIPFFFKNLLDTPYARKATTKMGAGAQHYNIGQDGLSKIALYFPKIDEQEKIADLFKILNKKIYLQKKNIELLKLYKRGLISKIFPKNTEKKPLFRLSVYTSDWEQHKLGDVCERVQGNDGRMNLPTLTISAANGWMSQEDRFSGNIAGKEQKNYTLLHKGELSYNHGNSKLAKYGTVFSLETYEEALVPKVYHSFRMTKGDAIFIEYYFATKIPDRELAKLISSGARMDGLLNIGFNEFMGINIKLPSVCEQEKISEYLRKLDNLITLHQKKYYSYEKIKSGLLQQMFI